MSSSILIISAFSRGGGIPGPAPDVVTRGAVKNRGDANFGETTTVGPAVPASGTGAIAEVGAIGVDGGVGVFVAVGCVVVAFVGSSCCVAIVAAVLAVINRGVVCSFVVGGVIGNEALMMR